MIENRSLVRGSIIAAVETVWVQHGQAAGQLWWAAGTDESYGFLLIDLLMGKVRAHTPIEYVCHL